jgi:hypothetical protein
MLQAYIANVLIFFGRMLQQMLLCCKCLMSRRDKGTQAKVVPSGAAVPACTAGGAEHKDVSIDVAVGAEHEAAYMDGQHARTTRRSGAQSCIHGQQ